jgi:tRNA(fMet)-specific endonuclease VapC
VKRYLLDTGIAGDFVNRRGRVREQALAITRQGGRVGTALIVLGELVAGIEHSSSRDLNLQRLNRAIGTLTFWPFDRAAAFEYGRLWAELKRQGRLMQQNDIQIAAIALALRDCVVVSKDSDLRAVPGLQTEDWSSV